MFDYSCAPRQLTFPQGYPTRFAVFDAEKLCTILPQFYRHASWSAFVRQLANYGFARMQDHNATWVFEYVQARKNEREQLSSAMTRVVPMLTDSDVDGASDRNEDARAQDAHTHSTAEATALITKLETAMANHERIVQYQTRIIELLAHNPNMRLLAGDCSAAAHGRDSSTNQSSPSPLVVGEMK